MRVTKNYYHITQRAAAGDSDSFLTSPSILAPSLASGSAASAAALAASIAAL